MNSQKGPFLLFKYDDTVILHVFVSKFGQLLKLLFKEDKHM